MFSSDNDHCHGVAATELRHMLEAEGASFCEGMSAIPLPAMGGGMGVVARHRIPAGTLLATLPFRSMITVRKARFNIALAEHALASIHTQSNRDASPVVPFAAHVWSREETAAYCASLASSEVTAEAHRENLDAIVRRLEDALSPTHTIVCYILLMAALHGALNKACDREASAKQSASARQDESQPMQVLRFTHENRWMRLWLQTLPQQYDNLLECGSGIGEDGLTPFEVGPRTYQRLTAYTTTAASLRDVTPYPRHAAKVLMEQRHLTQGWRHAKDTLRFLRWLPVGVCVNDGPEASLTGTTIVENQLQGPTSCTLGHYLWAFNTLMSRGFGFSDELWAVMPFVDYFNYALESNGTMGERVLEGARRTRNSLTSSALHSLRDPNDYAFEFSTVTNVTAGEQILLHYGAYSDFELLMWYGFSLRPSLLPEAFLNEQQSRQKLQTVDVSETAGSVYPPSEDASALSWALPQLHAKGPRHALFERFCVFNSQASSLNDEGTVDEESSAAARGEARRVQYDVWSNALQRAYSHVLSPLSNTDGVYPSSSVGQTWLDNLLRGAASTTATWRTPPSCCSRSAVQMYATLLANAWHGVSGQSVAVILAPYLSSSCALGALGPSTNMRRALQILAKLCASDGGCAGFLKAHDDGGTAATWVLRAIAWLELSPVQKNAAAHGVEKDADRAEAGYISPAAVSMLRVVSQDVTDLLRFLSCDATESQLLTYLSGGDARGY